METIKELKAKRSGLSKDLNSLDMTKAKGASMCFVLTSEYIKASAKLVILEGKVADVIGI